MTKVYLNNKSNDAVNYVKDVAELVENGEIDPVKAFLLLKQIENKSKEYKKKIEEIALDELAKYGSEGAEIDGYKVTLKKSAGRWNFKHIEDIVDAEEKLRQLKIKHKGAYLQMVHNITSIGDGGELIKPAEFKNGKQIISITKKDAKI